MRLVVFSWMLLANLSPGAARARPSPVEATRCILVCDKGGCHKICKPVKVLRGTWTSEAAPRTEEGCRPDP
jgi:hypothetical protein